MALISYIGPYYLLDFEYLLQYEVGINVFFMPLARLIEIQGFQWISWCILTKLNSKQVERITCKNKFLLLLHKCLKRCIYAVVLLLCDFSFSWNARKSQSAFQKNQSGMRNFYLENSFAKVSFSFDVSLKLIK